MSLLKNHTMGVTQATRKAILAKKIHFLKLLKKRTIGKGKFPNSKKKKKKKKKKKCRIRFLILRVSIILVLDPGFTGCWSM